MQDKTRCYTLLNVIGWGPICKLVPMILCSRPIFLVTCIVVNNNMARTIGHLLGSAHEQHAQSHKKLSRYKHATKRHSKAGVNKMITGSKEISGEKNYRRIGVLISGRKKQCKTLSKNITKLQTVRLIDCEQSVMLGAFRSQLCSGDLQGR